MSHEELRGHYELFAIDAADEPQRSEIRQHLSEGCAICTAEMERARRLTARIRATRRFGWAPFLGLSTALTLFAAIYFSGREHQMAAQSIVTHEQMRQQTVELTRLKEAFAILSGGSTVEAASGKRRVYVDRERGVLLIAPDLGAAPEGMLFEMWLAAKDGKATSAGVFRPDASGAAIHLWRGTVDRDVTSITLSLEKGAAASAPSNPIMTVPIQ